MGEEELRLVGVIVKPDGQVSVNSKCLRGYSLLDTFSEFTLTN